MSHHVNPLLGDAPPSEAALSRRGSMGLSSRGSGPGPCLMCAMALVFAVAMTALVLSVLVIVGTLPAGHLRTGPRGSQGANGANAIGSAFISTSVYDMNLTSTLHAVLGSDSLPLLFGFDANYALWVYHCGDYACSASSATLSRVIDPQRLPLVSAPLLRAAVGGDGLVYIVYQTDTVQILHCLNLVCSSVQHTDTKQPSPGGVPTIVTSPVDGHPIIVTALERTLPAAELLTLHCPVSDCSTVSHSYHHNTYMQGGSIPAAAISPTGVVTLVWVGPYFSHRPLSLYVGSCVDGTCHELATVREIPGSGNVTIPAMVFTPDGSLLLAFYDIPVTSSSSMYVQLLHCESPACEAPQWRVPVRLPAQSGPDIVGLLVDSRPMFATVSGHKNVVPVLHCNDANCTQAAVVPNATPAAAQVSCELGGCISAFVGPNGLPVIVVGGYTAVTLVRCSNPFCLPFIMADALTS